MIRLLGKRPFAGRADDMDKWLDEHQKEKGPIPSPEAPPADVDDGHIPAPAIFKRLNDKTML